MSTFSLLVSVALIFVSHALPCAKEPNVKAGDDDQQWMVLKLASESTNSVSPVFTYGTFSIDVSGLTEAQFKKEIGRLDFNGLNKFTQWYTTYMHNPARKAKKSDRQCACPQSDGRLKLAACSSSCSAKFMSYSTGITFYRGKYNQYKNVFTGNPNGYLLPPSKAGEVARVGKRDGSFMQTYGITPATRTCYPTSYNFAYKDNNMCLGAGGKNQWVKWMRCNSARNTYDPKFNWRIDNSDFAYQDTPLIPPEIYVDDNLLDTPEDDVDMPDDDVDMPDDNDLFYPEDYETPTFDFKTPFDAPESTYNPYMVAALIVGTLVNTIVALVIFCRGSCSRQTNKI